MEFTKRVCCSIHPRTFLSEWVFCHFSLNTESYVTVAFMQEIRSQVLMNSKDYFILLGIVPIKILNTSNSSQGGCGSIK